MLYKYNCVCDKLLESWIWGFSHNQNKLHFFFVVMLGQYMQSAWCCWSQNKLAEHILKSILPHMRTAIIQSQPCTLSILWLVVWTGLRIKQELSFSVFTLTLSIRTCIAGRVIHTLTSWPYWILIPVDRVLWIWYKKKRIHNMATVEYYRGSLSAPSNNKMNSRCLSSLWHSKSAHVSTDKHNSQSLTKSE